ncbi:LOW QUALITY PROTEIN: serine/arginine repetitive matrix protein 2 [Drosophila tropicalis]|uniref:LOW QUALITY PROTEIN: serine/arginine repetitive matrix protein 2 n=1 Tax=Drosophila tropicalis TaxID=46794 RepID=UPI0035ABD793
MSTLAGVAVEELQDGDTSSLEPGEVVTPPRNTSSPAGAKKLLSKDLMSRTLRKLTAAITQIDGHENGDCEGAGASARAGGEATKAHGKETDKKESEVTANDEAKVRSKLELEIIRRKEEKLSVPGENGIKDENNIDGDDDDVAKAEQRTAPPNDDDEGLYSDTDSSGDEQQQQLQQNVEDVQQARKEKQLEAAAAQAQAQVPPQSSPHPFLRCSPMRFHSRPVCFDFPRMGFMPRMVMLGHNRLRPPTFFNGNRSQTPQRLVSPMKSNSGSPALTPSASGSNGGGAGVAGAVGGPVYGPVLPPSIAKKPQSELVWTSCQPPVSYIFNLVNGCGNQQHKDCKHKDSASECKDEKHQKQAKSKDHKRESKRERSKDRKSPRSNDRKRDLLKERQKERSREKIRESSTKEDLPKMQKPKDKSREQHQPKDKSKDDKSRIDTKEKSSRAPSKDKGRDEPKVKRQRDVSKEKVMDKIKDSSSTSKHHTKDKLKNDTKEPSRDLSKESHRESREQPKTKSRETHRERSHEPAKDPKSRDRSKDKHKERSRERKEHPAEHRDKARERSKEDKHRERDRDREEMHKKRSRSREDRKDKLKRRSRSRSKTRQHVESKARTPPPPATPTLYPTATPPVAAAEMPQETMAMETQETPTASLKPFDIFAESPPRLNAIRNESKTAESLPLAASASPPANTTNQMQTQTQTPPPQKSRIGDRSTTPPLNRLHGTPLLRASEIHSRIGALLNDNDDLHLEALLAATKEQLLKKEKKSTDGVIPPPSIKFHVNPFKKEVVLNNSQNERDRDTDKKDRDSTSSRSSRTRIKIEKYRSPSPVSTTLPMPSNIKIKIERNMTPPPVPMPPVATVTPVVEECSPDTDDYIDNWENDDSLMMMPSVLNTKTEINQPPQRSLNYINGDLADDDSNTLWNAKSTPPPKAKQGGEGGLDEPATPNNLNINDIYDRFMNCIQEGNNTTTERDNGENAGDDDDEEEDNAEDSSSDSSSTSTSSSTNSSSESTSSSDSDDSSDDSEDEVMEDHVPEESTAATAVLDEEKMLKQEIETDKLTSSNNPNLQKKNNVSKDLRKLKNLEDNLGRIQMMRENYDPGDDICEELLKMESLFQMQRNAIMDKYRKHEQASSAASITAISSNPMIQNEQQQQQLPAMEARPPSPPVNSIFDANREAIKLTISPLKLTRKSVIFDKDDTEQQQQQQQQQKTNTPTRPPKEIAIVKPTILETRSKALSTGSRGGSKNSSSTSNSSSSARRLQTPRDRTHSRSRSISRQRSNRRRGGTPSPKRWRPPSPINRRGSSRSRYGKIRLLPRSSRSRTLSRSRTRSRSPHRRARRAKHLNDEGRRRKPLSPLRHKNMGPRSPPPPSSLSSSSLTRRRSYSRSRSPLPFKPPSPPMRRSWSRSPPGGVGSGGGEGKRRFTRSRSHSRSRSRTPMSPQRQSFADYFEENPGLEAAAACYYYNMYHQDQDGSMAAMGDNYGDAGAYAAYMDASSYTNMEQAYAQYTEYNAQYDYGMGLMEPNAAPTPGVLRELPKAPTISVAVQKGNVLEIVPSAGLDITQNTPIAEITPKPSIEEPIEDKSKPKRKRVNFVDNVLPNYESESEDRSIVERAVERALQQYREKRSTMAAKLQRIKDELMALPPPPPPLTPKPPNLDKPVMVQKKPKFLYFHFDPHKGAIIKGHTRMVRPPPGAGHPHHHHHLMPRFDAKRFSMLMKSGNLPPLPPHLLRQRPPWLPPPHADAMTKASIFKEFFSKHPPPPLPHYQNILHTLPARPIDTMDSDTIAAAATSVTSAAAAAPPPLGVSQPIPVLGGGHNNFILPMTVGPVPAPLPVPPIAVDTATPASLSSSSSSSSVLTLPFFTPPPLPQFTVQSVPSIREIMPVDILQKLGPLPKTLDLEEQPTTPIQGNDADEPPASSSPSINTDLSKEKQFESNPTAADPSEQEPQQQTQSVVEQPPAQPMLLVETQ